MHLMPCSFGGLPNSQMGTGPHCLPGLPANKTAQQMHMSVSSLWVAVCTGVGVGTGDPCACGLSLSATSCWRSSEGGCSASGMAAVLARRRMLLTGRGCYFTDDSTLNSVSQYSKLTVTASYPGLISPISHEHDKRENRTTSDLLITRTNPNGRDAWR